MKWEEGEGGIHYGSIAGTVALKRNNLVIASNGSVLISRRTGNGRDNVASARSSQSKGFATAASGHFFIPKLLTRADIRSVVTPTQQQIKQFKPISRCFECYISRGREACQFSSVYIWHHQKRHEHLSGFAL